MKLQVAKIIRSNRKTVALYIQPDGSLVVRAPFCVPNKEIKRFVYKKRFWIDKKRELIQERNKLRRQKEFVDGEGFLYLGETYKLCIVDRDGPALLFDGRFLFSGCYLHNAREVFVQWYRGKAREKISERVEFYIRRTGEKYRKINITAARHRWGSCSSRGTLNFSWRLILAPLEVVDYVVVHEIAHLKENNHSQKFWRRVKALLPDYESRREWLKENEHLLVI